MALDVTEVVNLGGCAVSINGVDVGHTDETGAKVTLANTIVEAKAGKYGDTPVAKWLNGQKISVEFNLIQANFANLEKVLPGATKVTSGPNSKLTWGKIAGTPITAVPLILTPFPSGNSPKYDLTIVKAVPVGDFETMYTGGENQKWKIKFEGLINEASGSDGSYLFTFGDAAITGDVTPPSISARSPLENAVGVAVGASVVATLSEDLDADTVNAFTVKLIADPLGAQSDVAGTITLVNAGAGTTITFDPTSDLAAATVHLFILDGVKDKNGNALPFDAWDFTTA